MLVYARPAIVHDHTQRGLLPYWVLVCYIHNTHMQDPDLYCYSLFYFAPYDPEDIWSLVQRHGGFISVHPGGHYEFLIPRDYASILVLAFPLLKRQRQKDLYT